MSTEVVTKFALPKSESESGYEIVNGVELKLHLFPGACPCGCGQDIVVYEDGEESDIQTRAVRIRKAVPSEIVQGAIAALSDQDKAEILKTSSLEDSFFVVLAHEQMRQQEKEFLNGLLSSLFGGRGSDILQ